MSVSRNLTSERLRDRVSNIPGVPNSNSPPLNEALRCFPQYLQSDVRVFKIGHDYLPPHPVPPNALSFQLLKRRYDRVFQNGNNVYKLQHLWCVKST
jgi:hypothetical protein